MTVRTERWPNGTPNWVDLASRDLPGTLKFYSALFGWEYVSAGAQAGGYMLALKDGQHVAGLGHAQDEAQPTVWTTFFAHDDIQRLMLRVDEAGGVILFPPIDVLNAGRMMIAAGPDGAQFGVWQAKEHIGSTVVNEHGTFVWNELWTRDMSAMRNFYADVFDHEFADQTSPDGYAYSTFRSRGRLVGSFQEIDSEMPRDMPSHWLTWFACDDVDEAARTAVAEGGSVLMSARDSPVGRLAILVGPQHETFGVITTPGTGLNGAHLG